MDLAILDVITIGRASVDLYGEQIGGRLEDIASFTKAVGGCPTNIAIGTSRLGLRSGVITRVGDEQMGRFIREQLGREGVMLDGVHTDPARLTALVLLAVRDRTHFPMIFYRDNCADAALDEDDIDPAYIARARAVLVTGTHFAYPAAAAAQRKAISLAQGQGARVIFDIDYRPNLWGLAGHEAGESRYLRSRHVTDTFQSVLPACNLVVGTEGELHIAGGSEDTLEAIATIRALTRATIVCKRGPMGCLVFPGAIPARLEDGISGPGFPVEVYNTLGAGDAFMSGFLRGWLRDEPLDTCCAFANACGALTVSRLLCSTEIPTFVELRHFLEHGSPHHAVRHDAVLNHIHAATTRITGQDRVMALAIDHRVQLEAIADQNNVPYGRISVFKQLALDATLEVADGRPGFGILLDGTYGQEALFRAAGHDLWLARPVELSGSRPLEFEATDLGTQLGEWPTAQIVKCLCFYHPDDDAGLKLRQEREMLRAAKAAHGSGHELLLEIVAGRAVPLADHTVADVLDRLYDIGLRPEWWKLEQQPGRAAWRAIGDVIRARDSFCRGIVMLGLDAAEHELIRGFANAAAEPLVRGFAVGRTIFAEPAQQWFAGRISDDQARSQMAGRFAALVAAWQAASATIAVPAEAGA